MPVRMPGARRAQDRARRLFRSRVNAWVEILDSSGAAPRITDAEGSALRIPAVRRSPETQAGEDRSLAYEVVYQVMLDPGQVKVDDITLDDTGRKLRIQRIRPPENGLIAIEAGTGRTKR